VQCQGYLVSDLRVALAATLLHSVWVRGLGYKACMTRSFIFDRALALVAGDAGHRMIGVRFYRMAVQTPHHFCCLRLFVGAADEKEQY
jgi:hypothetical protein